ncbi:MBL fold metallo-hydrolase [Actinorhabdospora filicis]|uniref:MBL fold metallo-hydrolase n=1 Tax=Actinorhabdospora filicis TaxID=1785913 RepID=A0A9W6SL64_9ACTN|nr:MBL fold metallo-hydrolase [Actinorhabdospora filicis]GLZ77724.1 MBL fold metallo-hydrolase [Actinorhabdospora filicis]
MGFLLEWAGFRLVLDLGWGTATRLLDLVTDVDAVAVTHEHPDHCADLGGLARARYFAAERGPVVPLFTTPGTAARVQAMEPTEALSEVFALHELPGTYPVGPFGLSGALLPHFVPHAGVRLSGPLEMAYSGDAGAGAELDALAAGASVLIAGVTHGPGEPSPLLLRAGEAGACAARAGVSRLVLTHFWPGSDRAAAVAEARAAFGGEIIAAEDGMVIHL